MRRREGKRDGVKEGHERVEMKANKGGMVAKVAVIIQINEK